MGGARDAGHHGEMSPMNGLANAKERVMAIGGGLLVLILIIILLVLIF